MASDLVDGRGADGRGARRAQRPCASSSSATSRRWSSAASTRCCRSSARGMARPSARSWPARDRASGGSARTGPSRSAASSCSPTSSSSPRGHGRATRSPRRATCSSRSTPTLDDELRAAEGLAREVAHRLQALRRERGLRDQRPRPGTRSRLTAEAERALDPHLEWLAERAARHGRVDSGRRPTCRTRPAADHGRARRRDGGARGRPRLILPSGRVGPWRPARNATGR